MSRRRGSSARAIVWAVFAFVLITCSRCLAVAERERITIGEPE